LKLAIPGALPDVPADVLRECSDRLGIAALAWGGLWALAAVANNLATSLPVPGPADGGAWPWPGTIVAAGCVLLSLGVFGYTRRAACDTRFSLDLGLAYEVPIALGISLVTQWSPNAGGAPWIVLLILVHPTIVPNMPHKTLLAGLAAASMVPVAVGIGAARGVPLPPTPTLIWAFLPNYLAAVLAVLPAWVIGRLGREVGKARQVGNYELGELLGRGGMGEVYRARHRLLRRPAAVKLIRPDAHGTWSGSSRDMIAQRFWREAEAAASLSSPHTIGLYDFGVARDGAFFYVMELLEGVDFESLVTRFGPIPAARVVHLLRQACDSLAEAHAIGLVHRDIKPANLYASRIGLKTDFVKVLDFGLVRLPDDHSDAQPGVTAPGMVIGTPAFMSPEVAVGNRQIDHRADIYALGCVGYWLLTGRRVFEAESSLQVMIEHVQGEPIPPSRRSELVIPECLDAIVLACLAKRPDDRPADAAQLSRLLSRCEVGEPWTDESAARWWQAHLPEHRARQAAGATAVQARIKAADQGS
jgi:serine/threonine-protein kinase